MTCEKIFFKQLRERGFRLTPQREMILSVMHGMEGFTTAEEIYADVQQLSSSVDISTVYRTLDLLQDFHFVAAVDWGEGQRRYRLWREDGPHLHLVCQSCGEVVGIELSQIQSFVTCLEDQTGFALDLENLSLPGLCKACRTAGD